MKKFISIALAIILALSVMPMAYALDLDFDFDVHMHSVSNSCSTEEGDQVIFLPLTKEILGEYERLGGGNFYLAEDIVLDYQLEIFNDANICLNGHTITSTREYNSGHAYSVIDPQGGTFSICDCKGNGEIISKNVGITARADVCNMYNIKITARSNGIYVSDGCTFNMYGGKIYSESIGVDASDENNTINLYSGIIGADYQAVYGSANNFGTEICKDLCHKNGFMGLIWKIVCFIYKLMGKNPECACGAVHY
ncbi:MAG: hypothetical protein J6Q79_07595 [Clostridia bacterium]|nr:hypothetical protein [Clostridia bacterium]